MISTRVVLMIFISAAATLAACAKAEEPVWLPSGAQGQSLGDGSAEGSSGHAATSCNQPKTCFIACFCDLGDAKYCADYCTETGQVCGGDCSTCGGCADKCLCAGTEPTTCATKCGLASSGGGNDAGAAADAPAD